MCHGTTSITLSVKSYIIKISSRDIFIQRVKRNHAGEQRYEYPHHAAKLHTTSIFSKKLHLGKNVMKVFFTSMFTVNVAQINKISYFSIKTEVKSLM